MLSLLLILAALGHVIFWAAAVNRIHGVGIDRRGIDAVTAACGLAMALIPLPILLVLWQRYRGEPTFGGAVFWNMAWTYVCFCALFAVVAAVKRVWLVSHPERRGALAANHTQRKPFALDRASQADVPRLAAAISRLPLNEVFDLHLHEKRLVIPRMPAGAELRIAHVSDFHMSGRIPKEYFEHAVEEANRLEADLIAVTGDLVDNYRCVDWLPDTIGRLRAPAGVYFVRGNHDRRIRQQPLLEMIERLGVIHLNGAWRQRTIRDVPIVLAGNEIPWFRPAPDLADAPPRDASGLPLRFLLAHGPDQFTWAQQNDFDLVLAGHNHGGQVRLPLLGAILAPSLSGTRYAGGVFRRGNTLMHVSRGTGSHTPLRWNCPPEVALLTLSQGHSGSA
jgi:predicted MPP superfamily phosphohydrolase